MTENRDKVLLPHHEQQELCTTRLPYRQGRKLTAVKVYTVNNESNHLLIFGVPSLNLRQEIKALFARFGKLQQFKITTDHPAEVFTETYHASFEKIQSARVAKRMMDTKNFYGGVLHVCYAPELESAEETRQKILKRKHDVLFRLRNLETDVIKKKNDFENNKINEDNHDVVNETNKRTLNMGEINTIIVCKKKRKGQNVNKHESTPIVNEINEVDARNHTNNYNVKYSNATNTYKDELGDKNIVSNISKVDEVKTHNDDVEIVDFTSTDKEIVSNINEALNYNKFGNEVIRKVPQKPVNRITFNINKKS